MRCCGQLHSEFEVWCGGLLGPLGTAQARDVLARLLGKLMRGHMVLAVRLQKPAPPGDDQPALFEELGLVGISGADVVAFLVAHLSLDSRLRPEPILDERTARHGSEPGAADIHLSESGTHREHKSNWP